MAQQPTKPPTTGVRTQALGQEPANLTPPAGMKPLTFGNEPEPQVVKDAEQRTVERINSQIESPAPAVGTGVLVGDPAPVILDTPPGQGAQQKLTLPIGPALASPPVIPVHGQAHTVEPERVLAMEEAATGVLTHPYAVYADDIEKHLIAVTGIQQRMASRFPPRPNDVEHIARALMFVLELLSDDVKSE